MCAETVGEFRYLKIKLQRSTSACHAAEQFACLFLIKSEQGCIFSCGPLGLTITSPSKHRFHLALDLLDYRSSAIASPMN